MRVTLVTTVVIEIEVDLGRKSKYKLYKKLIKV